MSDPVGPIQRNSSFSWFFEPGAQYIEYYAYVIKSLLPHSSDFFIALTSV